MKRVDLIQLLREHGWEFSEGGSHTLAKHPDHPAVKLSIPRHREIAPGTARQILKAAGLK